VIDEPLEAAAIRAGLAPSTRPRLADVTVLAEVDSTNAYLARSELPSGGISLCTAEAQTAGRGRRGRSWFSPHGQSVYLSLGWRYQGSVEALQGLSLAVGVVVCDVLEMHGASDLRVKWPNDILRQGRKLAGILVELSGVGEDCRVIIGLGVNGSLPRSAVTEIDQPWADLHDLPVSRNRLIADVVERLIPMLEAFPERRFAPWKDAWERRNAHADRAVAVEVGGKVLRGTVRGVDATGALRLDTDQGEVLVQGGEVSLRAEPA